MIADDGFAGAGGWDLGALALGIQARGIEIMPEARATREAAGLETIHDDAWTFTPDGKAVGKIDSPPCQTFSTAGKGAGRRALDDVLRGIRDRYYLDLDHLRFLGAEVGDDRTALVLTPLHFATQYEYEWLAWEQVPTVLPVWEACAEVLREQGWHVWTGLLHSEQYGVPQTRKRAFLLASRHHKVGPPAPTHSRYYPRSPERLDPGVPKWVSMAEALDWSPIARVVSNYGSGGDASARGERTGTQPAATVTSKIDRNTVFRNGNQANSATRRSDQPASTIHFGKRSNAVTWETPTHLQGSQIPPDWTHNPPATTIVGTFRPEVVAAPGYRTTVSRQDAPDSVRVTVQEAGILQSFPAEWPWQGSKSKQYLQVGNAVPPLLAMHALAAAVGIDVREVAA